MRYYLNEQLARNEKLAETGAAIYSPAIVRARLRTKTTYDVVRAIESVVQEVALELRKKAKSSFSHLPIGVPQIAAALVKKARSEPKALIEVAIEARAEASPRW